MSTRYVCDNLKPIRQGAWNSNGSDVIRTTRDAAKEFAQRLARKQYGRNGVVASYIRADSWTQDGSQHNFVAFMGKPVRGDSSHKVEGRNVAFTVYVKVD